MTLRANAGRLLVHQIAAAVVCDVTELARTLRGPGALQRGDQMVRAACSVTSNIAEACGRASIGEFRQFLNYARGSAHELRSQLEVTRRVDADQSRRCVGLISRVTLVIKLLQRLHDKPPPEK